MAVDPEIIKHELRYLKSLKVIPKNLLEPELVKQCFTSYCTSCALTKDDFIKLLDDLFTHTNLNEVEAKTHKEKLFEWFDQDKDQLISQEEFAFCWTHWIQQILQPINALLIVDVQNDFISGSLKLDGGEQVVPVINQLLGRVTFDTIVYTYDWHPANHISFHDNRHIRKFHHSSPKTVEEVNVKDTVVFDAPEPTEQRLWPRHCVQDTDGAALHPQLKIIPNSVHVYKGKDPEIDSYSAFWDNMKKSETELLRELASRNVSRVFVCGLAYDVCVGATAKDALDHGLQTVLISDASRGVCRDGIKQTNAKLSGLSGLVADSKQVEGMVNSGDRWLELGYTAAHNVMRKLNLVTSSN